MLGMTGIAAGNFFADDRFDLCSLAVSVAARGSAFEGEIGEIGRSWDLFSDPTNPSSLISLISLFKGSGSGGRRGSLVRAGGAMGAVPTGAGGAPKRRSR